MFESYARLDCHTKKRAINKPNNKYIIHMFVSGIKQGLNKHDTTTTYTPKAKSGQSKIFLDRPTAGSSFGCCMFCLVFVSRPVCVREFCATFAEKVAIIYILLGLFIQTSISINHQNSLLNNMSRVCG